MGGPPGPGGSPPPSPEELATGVYHFTITEYTAVAGAVVYYYDMMLTWGDEVRPHFSPFATGPN